MKKEKTVNSGVNGYHSINESHQTVINDISFQLKDDQKLNTSASMYIKLFCMQIYENYLEKIQVFTPDNIFFFFWQFAMLILIMTQVIGNLFNQKTVFPLKLGWDFEINIIYWNVLPIVMHIFDIFLTFNTAYYEEGLIIKDR